jgi:hypothetical protein
VATTVSLRSDETGTLYIDTGSRRSLLFSSFLPDLISCLASVDTSASGTNLCFETGMGSWNWGPLGHPGDGEFEVRSVNPLSVQVLASPANIVVTIRGCTEPGRALYKGVPDPERLDPLSPWRFMVEFYLSEEALKTLSENAFPLADETQKLI